MLASQKRIAEGVKLKEILFIVFLLSVNFAIATEKKKYVNKIIKLECVKKY